THISCSSTLSVTTSPPRAPPMTGNVLRSGIAEAPRPAEHGIPLDEFGDALVEVVGGFPAHGRDLGCRNHIVALVGILIGGMLDPAEVGNPRDTGAQFGLRHVGRVVADVE